MGGLGEDLVVFFQRVQGPHSDIMPPEVQIRALIRDGVLPGPLMPRAITIPDKDPRPILEVIGAIGRQGSPHTEGLGVVLGAATIGLAPLVTGLDGFRHGVDAPAPASAFEL